MEWTNITNEQAERMIASAEKDGITVVFSVPPENQGQIVEVSYADLGADGILERSFDRSDRSASYRTREWEDEDEDRPGMNFAPA